MDKYTVGKPQLSTVLKALEEHNTLATAEASRRNPMEEQRADDLYRMIRNYLITHTVPDGWDVTLKKCPECDGQGFVTGVDWVEHHAFLSSEPCPRCGGDGTQEDI